LFFNNVQEQSFSYTPVTPSWSAVSNFDFGASEYLSYGGYNTCDDAIAEFTVSNH
jgi:hypothetical protein